jgi:hypothetical protein
MFLIRKEQHSKYNFCKFRWLSLPKQLLFLLYKSYKYTVWGRT